MADSDDAYRIDGLRAFGVLDLSFASLDRLELIKGSTGRSDDFSVRRWIATLLRGQAS